MGSIFKSFTVASALNENLVNKDSKFDVREPLKLKGKTITDYHGEDRILDLEGVFTYSSNIGTAQIAQILGIDRQYSYFQNLDVRFHQSAPSGDPGATPDLEIESFWKSKGVVIFS